MSSGWKVRRDVPRPPLPLPPHGTMRRFLLSAGHWQIKLCIAARCVRSVHWVSNPNSNIQTTAALQQQKATMSYLRPLHQTMLMTAHLWRQVICAALLSPRSSLDYSPLICINDFVKSPSRRDAEALGSRQLKILLLDKGG